MGASQPRLTSSREAAPSTSSGQPENKRTCPHSATADRVKLLSLIAAAPGGEACICDLTEPVGLSQPTVSHHMKLLVDAGLVHREQRGRWAYYRPVLEGLQALATALTP